MFSYSELALLFAGVPIFAIKYYKNIILISLNTTGIRLTARTSGKKKGKIREKEFKFKIYYGVVWDWGFFFSFFACILVLGFFLHRHTRLYTKPVEEVAQSLSELCI